MYNGAGMKINKEVKISIELNSEWEVDTLIQSLIMVTSSEELDKNREEFIKKIIDGLKV